MNFRKLIGQKPKVGDHVNGALDFSVSYDGIVVKEPTNQLFLCYLVEGIITIQTDWRGAIKEQKEFIVPAHKICWA